jgi:predicted transcriptional regulator
MYSDSKLKNEKIFNKVKILSNRKRFKIIELTQNKELSISEISSILNLSYTKCADYITALQKENLVQKRKAGKVTLIKSKVRIKEKEIKFF